MNTLPEFERLSSGKVITRQFDPTGQLIQELHTYGNIGIIIEYEDQKRTSEMYVVNNRVVSRKRYETARLEFPDMPAADLVLADDSGQLAKAANRERREHAKAARDRMPDPTAAAETDAFCKQLMQTGRQEDAIAWIKFSGNSLGEYPPAKSRKLVVKLAQLGCQRILACDVKDYDNAGNTGHLVVELPSEASRRVPLFKELDKLARQSGYSGDFDNGQKYAYIKLD